MKTNVPLRIIIPEGELRNTEELVAECPDCLALVRAVKLEEHQERAHG